MDSTTVDCPACPASASVVVPEDVAIYRIEAFASKPRRLPFSTPTPLATLGEKLYLDRGTQHRCTTHCDDGHYLRVLTAAYVSVPQENCLYLPADPPQVECPNCRFCHGRHDEFVYRADATRPDSTHVLRSVTREPEPGHTEVNTVSRQTCISHDRVVVPARCPHCGELAYFNYRTLGIDPTVYFVGVGE